jgi:hypothetical protein
MIVPYVFSRYAENANVLDDIQVCVHGRVGDGRVDENARGIEMEERSEVPAADFCLRHLHAIQRRTNISYTISYSGLYEQRRHIICT